MTEMLKKITEKIENDPKQPDRQKNHQKYRNSLLKRRAIPKLATFNKTLFWVLSRRCHCLSGRLPLLIWLEVPLLIWEVATAYLVNIENKASQSSWAWAGTELGNLFVHHNLIIEYDRSLQLEMELCIFSSSFDNTILFYCLSEHFIGKI